ncbi:YSIRK-type signal peptide-containing protein [Streptococcus suis]|uniref:YSIRK-type signal peptide-containing protein n=1 Tax=Streptococcus suis TaxID=1307 RepID=A0A426T6G8_STRSU|nr:ZmpA/ZmpB/ZmpC family metallo-endopeptidase [Streptococcus suis]RRR49536.1 YSIRK-type signal peptide-containing protein [Streptococcus suis]
MHKFFYEQRKAFSFRKLTIGLVSLCVGTSLLFGIQSQEVSASTVSPSQIRFEYVLEAELSAEERQLIQSSLPAELKEEATYFVVYRPSKKVLPATGELAGSGLAVLGLGFLVLAVSATKSKKARVLTMLYVTTSGLALPVLEVGAVQSSALAAYNQTYVLKPGEALPDGRLMIAGYDFVGYYVQESSVKTSPETAEVDKQISTGEVSGKPDQASQPIVEQADKTEQTGKTEESQDQADLPTESPVEETSPRPEVEKEVSAAESTETVPAQPTEESVEEKLITTIPTEAPRHLLPTIDFQVQDKVEETALEIPEEQIETNQLPLGQSRVEEGQAGSLRISYQEVLVDGQVVARNEISREEIPSIPRKVYIGTGQVAQEEVAETKPSEEPVQPTEEQVEEKLITTIPTEAPRHHLPTIDFQVQDKVEETALEIPEEQIETDELAIGQSRVEEGQAGSLRISYQEVLVDGQIVARNEISREEIPSIPKRTYIGTRRDEKYVAPAKLELPTATIRTQEEEIAFERKEVLRADWPLGKVEVVAGKKGKQLHTYAVIEGVETLLKTEVLEQAEAEITYKGVKRPEMTTEEVVIDFTERVISDSEQYTDYRQIEVTGEQGLKRLHKENGQLVNEEIVKPAKEQVVRVGTKPIEGQVEKESLRTIDFVRRYESNDQLEYGQTRTKRPGQSGQEKVISTYQTIKGVEGKFLSSRTELIKQVQDEIIEVGTKPQIRIEQEEPVIEYVPEPAKERNVQTVLQEGHAKETTYRTVYNLDANSGQVMPIQLPGTVSHPGQVRRISVGTKPTITKKALPFTEETIPNSTLYVGERVIVRPGRAGEEITTVHYTLNPRTGETSASQPQIQVIAAVTQVVQVGTKAVDRTEETVDNRDIAFKTEYRADSTLPYPQREVLQEGSNGVERITTTRRYVRDKEVGEPSRVSEVVKAVQNRIIKVGTKPAVRRVETDFTRVYEADPNRSLNEQHIKQSGIKQETTYTKNYVLNTETGTVTEQAETSQVTRSARQEIVQVGTRPTIETTSRVLPTRYEADNSRAHGQQHTRQQGRPEITTFTTTYSVDPSTGATQAHRDSGRVTDSGQQQIIQVGTRPVDRTERVELSPITRQNAELVKGTENVIHEGSPRIRVYRTNYSVDPTTGQITTHPEVLVSETAGRAREVEIGTKEPNQPVTPPTENEESCPIIPDNSDGGTCEVPTEPTEKPSSPDLECILNPTDQCWPEEEETVHPETVAQLRAKMEELRSYKARVEGYEWHTYIDTVYKHSEDVITSENPADIRTQLEVIQDDIDFIVDLLTELGNPKVLVETDANSGPSLKFEVMAKPVNVPTDANSSPSRKNEDTTSPVTPKPEETTGTEKPEPDSPTNPPVTPKPNPEQPTVPDTPDTTETETPIDVDIDSLPKPTMIIRRVDLQKDSRKATIHYILEDPAERFEGAQAHLFVNDKIVSTVLIRRQNGKVQAEFTDLKPNVDYLVRTELTYSGTSESLVDSLADEASIEIEERQLQIKHIDRIELWKFENGKASIQRELATKPVNLTNYFAKVISNQQKEILLPISQVDLQSENGESFYLIKASLDNLVEEQSTSNSYSPGLTFRVAKQKTSTSTGTYTDFASLVRAMQERPSDTFVLGADLTASSVDLAGKDSYITNQFYGRLNGAGYTIYDLQAPLFHKTSGQIENLNLKDVAIYQKGKNEVGALAKEAGGGRIEKISVDGVVVGGNHVGGLLGSILNTRVTNITVRGRISSQSTDLSSNYLGGLAGWVGTGGQVQGVYADVILSTNSSRAKVGGIVGQMENTGSYIKKAYAQGMISAQKNIDSEAGGIVGMIAGTADSIIDDVISAVSVPNGGKVYQYVSDPAIQVKKIYVVDNEASGQDRNGQEILTVEEAKERLASYQIVEPIPAVPTVRQQHPQYNVDYSLHPHYQENRKLAYDNMEKLLPFFTKDVIVQQANRLSKDDPLVTKKLLDVIAIDGHNNDRPVFDTNGQRNYINKVMFHFEDGSIEYEWLVKKQDINSGVITEYFVVDREITYTPENLVQATNLNRLVDRLLPEFTGLEYRSQEVLSALGLTGYGNDFAIQELLFLNESFAKVKTNIRHYLRDILVSDRAISLTSETIENYIFDYIKNNKAQLLLGLAYMDRWYSIRYGDLNAQEWMIKKPDFFGNPVSSLDQLIMIGGLGAGALKPNNNYALGSQLVAKPAIKGNLFDYLEAYRKRFAPNQTDSDWFKSATKANIIETNSTVEEVRVKQEDTSNKKYSNRFYDKLKSDTWRFKEMALILLTMPSRDIFILTDMANTVIGSYDNQHGTPEQIEKAIEKTAKDWAGHADYLYRILPKEHKEKMFRQVMTWDTKMINRTWYEIDSLSSRSKNSFKYFYMPLGYSYPVGTGASAQSDLRDIFYFNADVNSQEGNRVYTHELTHVAEDDTYLLGHGRRSGTGHEIYARGLFETLTWFNQDLLGINSIFDFSNYEQASYGRRLTNLNPERFQSTQDLEKYMRGYMDVIYTLDYLEAEAVLKLSGTSSFNTAHRNWFNQMTTNANDETQIDKFNRATKFTSVEDFIDNGMVSRRSYDPPGHIVRETFPHDSYLSVNALNPIYGALNNDGVSRNEFEFRKIAFELLAEKGYENGFVPYLSNQYQSELGQIDSAGRIPDNQLISKISGGEFTNSAQFRKAMFNRRKDNLSQLKAVKIYGKRDGEGYFYDTTRTLHSIDELRQLMKEAVEYDANHLLYASQNPYASSTNSYDKTKSHVYSLKAAVLNGYLRATNDFRESIYVTNP